MARLLLLVSFLALAAADRSSQVSDGPGQAADKKPAATGDLAKIVVAEPENKAKGPVKTEVAEIEAAKETELGKEDPLVVGTKPAVDKKPAASGDLAKIVAVDKKPAASGDLAKIVVAEPENKAKGPVKTEVAEIEAAKEQELGKEDPLVVGTQPVSKPLANDGSSAALGGGSSGKSVKSEEVAAINDGNPQVASIKGELPQELRYGALASLAKDFASTASQYSTRVSDLEGRGSSAIDRSRTYASQMQAMKNGLKSFGAGVMQFRTAVKHNHTSEVSKIRKQLTSTKDNLPA